SFLELNRTHWAVKEGGIPREFLAKVVPSYDIVLSFAGEDRPYVEKVARFLRSKGVKVFYDKFEEAHLWGRDLAEHFDMIYGTSGRYCVIFISKDYVKKMWTRHERQTALARALKEQSEYILPARFDDTPVDAIRSTLAYISLSKLKPSEFAHQVLKKLGRDTA
ncbi:toll/interleukin-1 receptor domain-containing protein, partial [Pedosphaera parvula]